MSNNLLHIYGQNHEHDDVHIVGNRVALINLAEAIHDVLYHTRAPKAQTKLKEAMTADGEGYDVHVICNDSEWTGDYWRNLGLPYCSPSSQDMRPEAIWPWLG